MTPSADGQPEGAEAKRDLERLLADLRPALAPEPYVFVAAPRDAGGEAAPPNDPPPFAVVREEEGTTWIVRRRQADAAGLPYVFVAARITLRVPSALDAVGLTAAVATRLARAGIACNVIAGLRHDHLLVPLERADDALDLLTSLWGPGAT